MTTNKSEIVLYRAPTFSLFLVSLVEVVLVAIQPLSHTKSAHNFRKMSLRTWHVEFSRFIVDMLIDIIILSCPRDLNF